VCFGFGDSGENRTLTIVSLGPTYGHNTVRNVTDCRPEMRTTFSAGPHADFVGSRVQGEDLEGSSNTVGTRPTCWLGDGWKTRGRIVLYPLAFNQSYPTGSTSD